MMCNSTCIKIRKAVTEDHNAIYLLNLHEMHYDFPLESTASKLDKILKSPDHLVLVAELDGKVIGYVHACDYDLLYATNMKNIMGIAVKDKYKRMGVGRALLSAVEKWASENGAECIRLCSGEERINAHEFYKSCGYTCGKKQLNFKKELCQ